MFATFGAPTAWDVRTTGVDSNGGAFDSSVTTPGTDESQGSGVAITVTLTGTTTGTGSTAFTSTTHGPGNFIHIASGTGCTVGWYEILSQSGGTATFDHAMGSTSNACVGVIGGSLLTIAQANTNSVAGNTLWVKSGTYTITAVISISNINLVISGYGTTHGDNGTAPLVTTSTASIGIFQYTNTNNDIQIINDLALSTTGATPDSAIYQQGVDAAGQTFILSNSSISGAFPKDIDGGGLTHWRLGFIVVNNSEFSNWTSYGIFSFYSVITVTGSYFHTTTGGTAIMAGAGSSASTTISVTGTIFSGCTSFCIGAANGVTFVHNSAFYNNNTGVAVGPGLTTLIGNIFYGNGTGINGSGGSWTAFQTQAMSTISRNNAYGGNTTNFTGWKASQGDITLSAIPWVNAPTGNFALNSTAGGGATLKATGYPGTFPSGTTVGFPDVGPVQSTGGGGTTAGNFGQSN